MSSRPPTMTPKKEPRDDIIVKLECDDETKGLRLKIENMKIRCDPEDEPTSPIPDTPACKGYVIESDFVEAFLGECYYFVAPIQLDQGPSEFAVFSLSPSRRMVSLVDTNSSFHHHHIDRSFDPIVYFTIGDLPYQWDIQHGTLSSEQFGAGPSVPGLNLSGVQLYMNLGDAKALVDSLQCVNFPNLANLGLESPPLTDNNTPSPPNVADAPPPFTGAQLFDSSFRKGYFGHSPSQEEIDQWVDNSVKTDQAVRDGAHLKCPEQGCNASSRRPHALKTHLYTHYRIKPCRCELCDISVLTDANLDRHIRNAHTCPGCGIVGSVPVIKAHKAVCPRVATAPSERKAGRRGRNRMTSGSGIARNLKF